MKIDIFRQSTGSGKLDRTVAVAMGIHIDDIKTDEFKLLRLADGIIENVKKFF